MEHIFCAKCFGEFCYPIELPPNQGSRLGNSLLLQFTEKELGSVFAGSTSRGLAAAASGLEPPAKKKKVAGRE